MWTATCKGKEEEVPWERGCVDRRTLVTEMLQELHNEELCTGSEAIFTGQSILVPRAYDLFGQRWDRQALVSPITGCREFSRHPVAHSPTKVVGTRTQLPLKLAWQSQGQTLDAVEVHSGKNLPQVICMSCMSPYRALEAKIECA